LTYDEVKKITNQKLIKVDGKVRTDKTYPTGFMGNLSTSICMPVVVNIYPIVPIIGNIPTMCVIFNMKVAFINFTYNFIKSTAKTFLYNHFASKMSEKGGQSSS